MVPTLLLVVNTISNRRKVRQHPAQVIDERPIMQQDQVHIYNVLKNLSKHINTVQLSTSTSTFGSRIRP